MLKYYADLYKLQADRDKDVHNNKHTLTNQEIEARGKQVRTTNAAKQAAGGGSGKGEKVWYSAEHTIDGKKQQVQLTEAQAKSLYAHIGGKDYIVDTDPNTGKPTTKRVSDEDIRKTINNYLRRQTTAELQKMDNKYTPPPQPQVPQVVPAPDNVTGKRRGMYGDVLKVDNTTQTAKTINKKQW